MMIRHNEMESVKLAAIISQTFGRIIIIYYYYKLIT
jgi:hypothetical protein